jgi:hypothetical protein
MCTKSSTGFLARRVNSSPSTALKSSVLVLVLVVTSGFATAVDQKSSPKPCNISAEDASGLNVNPSTDVHALRDYMVTIGRMLTQEKFEELDCLADRARSGKERFSGGMWKLHVLYGGLYVPVQYPQHATKEDWNSLMPRLQRWVAARPTSVTARVALGWAYLNYAFDARGDGYASTVSGNGWKLFAERTAEAKRILEEARALPTKCPEWYVAMQKVAQNQSWDAADARALFDEANKFEPGYYYYARILANYLLPKWSGEAGGTEKFVQEIADRIGGDQGDILYFQIASANYVICGCGDDPHLSLPRIERGFVASEKQYGVSMLNLNRIAFLTTRFSGGDPIVADKALTRIGDQWDEETWIEKKDFDMAKNFSSFMAKRLAIETAADANMQIPEGLRYRASFEKAYKELVQQCVRPGGSDVGKFKSLIDVGAKGTVEDMRIYWHSPASACVYEKLRALQQEKATPFPPPPQSPYWVRIDLDWAEFAPVAAR